MKSRALHLLGIPQYHPDGFSRLGRQVRLFEGGGAEILYSDNFAPIRRTPAPKAPAPAPKAPAPAPKAAAPAPAPKAPAPKAPAPAPKAAAPAPKAPTSSPKAPTPAPKAAAPAAKAPAPAPASTSSSPFGALPANFSSIDWSRGPQTINGITYQPVFQEQGSGENLEIGQVQTINRYKAGKTGTGDKYEQLEPGTGKLLQTQVRPKSGGGGFFGDLWEAVSSISADIAPVAQYVPVVGQAVTAINAINAARQGDILPAIGTLANIGGYTEVAKGIKALDAAQKKDYLGAVMPALQATGIASLGGIDTKDIGNTVNVLRAIERKNPLALVGAASGYLPGPQMPGAFVDKDIQEGFFDPGGPGAVTPTTDIDSLFPEFEEPLLTAPPPYVPPSGRGGLFGKITSPPPVPVATPPAPLPVVTAPAPEQNAFLEANIPEPTTVEKLLQQQFPELYAPPVVQPQPLTQAPTPVTPVQREAFLEANIEDPVERLLARPTEEVDWSAVYATPTTNPVTGETIVGAAQTGYPVQDFGTAPQSDINQVYDRIVNDMGGFASTWQTVGSDRVMIQDDGSSIGVNTETNESYGLTPEETQRMVDAGLLNTAASGYDAAIRGTNTQQPATQQPPTQQPPKQQPPLQQQTVAPAPNLGLLAVLSSIFGQQQKPTDPYQVAQINARSPFGLDLLV